MTAKPSDSSRQPRKPAGTPSGGEFTAKSGSSPEMSLEDPPIDPLTEELTAATEELRQAQAAVETAKRRLRQAEVAILESRKDELLAEAKTKIAEYQAAMRGVEAVKVPSDLSLFDVGAARELASAANSLQYLAGTAVSTARQANGWGYDDPKARELQRMLGEDDESGGWGAYPRDRCADLNAICDYVEAFRRRGSKGSKVLSEAIAHIRRHGVRDYEGLPCAWCESPMNGYNDDTYYCRNCG